MIFIYTMRSLSYLIFRCVISSIVNESTYVDSSKQHILLIKTNDTTTCACHFHHISNNTYQQQVLFVYLLFREEV